MRRPWGAGLGVILDWLPYKAERKESREDIDFLQAYKNSPSRKAKGSSHKKALGIDCVSLAATDFPVS